MKREGEYVLKGCSYSQALSNSDGTVVYAVGNDCQIKEIEFQGNMTNATNPGKTFFFFHSNIILKIETHF